MTVRAVHQPPGAEISNEPDKAGSMRVEQIQWKRVVLAAGLVRVVADGFQGEHGLDTIPAVRGCPGMD